MIKKNYYNQNGCWNCKNVFCYYDHDEQSRYFCNSDKSKRPICGSILLHESFTDYTNGVRRWEKWCNGKGDCGRIVNPFGVCDDWKKK